MAEQVHRRCKVCFLDYSARTFTMKSRIFRLYVQTDEICLDLLRYVDKHIAEVDALGVGVHVFKVDKIDDTMRDDFERKGITRLPAMIAPDDTVFVGAKKVRAVFESNLDDGGDAGGDEPPMYETALEALQASEMFAGRDKHGRNVPRQDDEDSDEKPDYNRRVAAFNKRRPSRKQRERSESPERPKRRRDRSESESEEEEPAPVRRGRGRQGGAAVNDPIGDNIDERMLEELMKG